MKSCFAFTSKQLKYEGWSKKTSQTTSYRLNRSTHWDLKPINVMVTSRTICLNWSLRLMVNSYLLLFRSLELSWNLKLDFSGELIIFCLFNFFLILCHFRWFLLTHWVLVAHKQSNGAIFVLSNKCIRALILMATPPPVFIGSYREMYFIYQLFNITNLKYYLWPKGISKCITQ